MMEISAPYIAPSSRKLWVQSDCGKKSTVAFNVYISKNVKGACCTFFSLYIGTHMCNNNRIAFSLL